jgi:hypothetical protein
MIATAERQRIHRYRRRFVFSGANQMAKGQMRVSREKRKPKSDGPKKKVPTYMQTGSMASAKPEPLKVTPKK